MLSSELGLVIQGNSIFSSTVLDHRNLFGDKVMLPEIGFFRYNVSAHVRRSLLKLSLLLQIETHKIFLN